jgi:hypothetical protein
MKPLTVIQGEADFSDLSVAIGGKHFDALSAFTVSDDLQVTEIRGVGGRLVDMVPGVYQARGSVTLSLSSEKDFLTAANGGTAGRVTLGNAPKVWLISWTGGSQRHGCILSGVVLTGRHISHQERSGALTVSYDFKAVQVSVDGILPNN